MTIAEAKQNSFRDNALVLDRAARSDRHYAEYFKAILKELNAQLKEATSRVRDGITIPVTDDMMVRWLRSLIEVKAPLVTAMVIAGVELGDFELEGLSMAGFQIQTKQGVQLDVAIEEGFLSAAGAADIEAWLEESSAIETETSRKSIDRLFAEANEFIDERFDPPRGLTPPEIAQRMENGEPGPGAQRNSSSYDGQDHDDLGIQRGRT